MSKSFVIKPSLAAGAAMLGAFILAPQNASADVRCPQGGSDMRSAFVVSACQPAFPALLPLFRPVKPTMN